MGVYLNIGNAGFQSARNGEYVDKSGLISIVNRTLFTERRFGCVTRSRRFGKSMAAKMLCAYYDHSCDSRHLFADLQIVSEPSFEKHLNKYAVLYLDMTNFMGDLKDDHVVDKIKGKLKAEIIATYPIDQIHRKQYPTKVKEYIDNLMLVGINYDRETKQHTCRIEKC